MRVLELGWRDAGVPLQEQGLLLRDAVLLVALEGLLQRAEGQTAAHQVHHHHHKHGHHRLPLHDRVQSRPVCGRVHPRHHAGRAGRDGEARENAVTVRFHLTAHRVLHGRYAGLNQTGLDLLRRDDVCLDSH